jgi:hypothetical protein
MRTPFKAIAQQFSIVTTLPSTQDHQHPQLPTLQHYAILPGMHAPQISGDNHNIAC